MLTDLSTLYKLWHVRMLHLPRLTRYTLALKIDDMFTDAIDLCLIAGYTNRNQKVPVLQQLSTKIDSLKFFLKLLWEMQLIDHQIYGQLGAPLAEIGKKIGGWIRDVQSRNMTRPML